MKIWWEKTCEPVEIYNGGFPRKYLTVNAKTLRHRSFNEFNTLLKDFLFQCDPAFLHTLLKVPLKVDWTWKPLKWNWLFLRILSGGQKVFYVKQEKNYFSDLSHDVRKSFSANESYHFFFFIKDLKPVAVTYAFL